MNNIVQTLKIITLVVACMLVVVTLASNLDKRMIEIQSREATEEAYNDYLNSPRYRATIRALMDQYNELKDE